MTKYIVKKVSITYKYVEAESYLYADFNSPYMEITK